MPGMVQPRRASQTDLADDLGPQMQRRISLAPRRNGQFRPRGCCHRYLLTRQGRARSGPAFICELARVGDAGYFVFAGALAGSLAGSLAKAASTSSFLMRAPGFPGWPRFCSSVPSPIMPGCGVAGFFLVSLGSGFLVISRSPGATARAPTSRAPSGSASLIAESAIDQTGNTSRIGAFRASTLTARSAEKTAAPPPSRNHPHRIACQLIDKENLDHGKARGPPPANGGGT